MSSDEWVGSLRQLEPNGWAVYDRPNILYFEYAIDVIYFVNMVNMAQTRQSRHL